MVTTEQYLQYARIMRIDEGDFEEEKHPRDTDGRFVESVLGPRPKNPRDIGFGPHLFKEEPTPDTYHVKAHRAGLGFGGVGRAPTHPESFPTLAHAEQYAREHGLFAYTRKNEPKRTRISWGP